MNAAERTATGGLYRQLFNPELYLRAYGKIYRNDGSMTPGANAETVDGMSLKKIQAIIDALRHERYRWTPVRRVYIDKKGSTKKRPLGLPTWSDKLLQEVIRSLLEAYYEPQFSDHSHGSARAGAVTPLWRKIQSWRGTTWFIEGDISECFDRLDHADPAFNPRRGHPRQPLPAADRWTAPGRISGGMALPRDAEWCAARRRSQSLALQYLPGPAGQVRRDRPSCPSTTMGDQRKPYRPYMRLHKAIWKMERNGQRKEARPMRRQLQQLPSCDPNDPGYRRLHYIRYADDWLLGFTGTRREAEDIKGKVGRFLRRSPQAGTLRAQDLDHSWADGSGPLPRLRNRGPPR